VTIVFLAALIAGLALGVRVMLVGVERPRAFGETAAPTFRISPAMVGAFAFVFGATGYASIRLGLGRTEATVAAGLAAAIAAGATVRLMKRWWSIPVEHDVDDPRYVLQGHIAQVVSPIARGGEGTVGFSVGDTRRVVRARAVDDGALDEGTDVVIERLEDDLAYVEAWSQVEKRL
jgi:membrane protein implicated in regulation of membrane protease activity